MSDDRAFGPDLDDDPASWIPPHAEDEKSQPKGNSHDHSAQHPTPLVPKPWVYRDPATIPPREWLLGNILIRGYATVLGSTGGVGKTALAIAMALAFITGRRDILNLHVFQRGKVWINVLEDDLNELDRRIHAAMLLHEVSRQDIEGKLFINTGDQRPVLLARANKDGVFEVCHDAEALETGISADEIGLTIIDPLVKAHALIENSNEHMDKLEAVANGIAGRTRSAILLPCHFRKGSGEDGARDAIRGGGALVDGSRCARTLIPMGKPEADAFKIPLDQAFRYIRLTDAKANLAPKDRALWFKLESVELGNRDVHPAYPSGDNVQAVQPWQPPSPFEGLDLPTLERIFAKLREGPGKGWFYSPEPRAKFWAGTVIIELADKSKNQAASVLETWLESDVIGQTDYQTPQRNSGIKVTLNEEKITEMLAPLRAFDGH